MSPIRYLYLRPDLKRNDLGAVCFGYYFEDNKIIYAYSICSPKDHFSRKIAHSIIMGRLKKYSEILPFESEKEPKYFDVVDLIKKDCLENRTVYFPLWAIKLLS